MLQDGVVFLFFTLLGRPVDEGVLREIIDVYIGLDSNGLFLYQRELEDYLLPDTADYYSRVSDQWIESLRFTDYLQRTQVSFFVPAVCFVRCFLRLRSFFSTPNRHAAVTRQFLLASRILFS